MIILVVQKNIFKIYSLIPLRSLALASARPHLLVNFKYIFLKLNIHFVYVAPKKIFESRRAPLG